MFVHVRVSGEPGPGPLTNSATVSGGGAPEASAQSTNPISETPAPFGIERFAAFARNPDGSPSTAAGAHPYEFSTEVTFNTVKIHGESYEGGEKGLEPEVVTVSGDPKDLTIGLPPGLVGNPRAVPQCSLSQFQAQACPPDSQVGIWKTSILQSQKVNPGLIYNVTPQPGQAAALGFVFHGLAFIAQAGVRSGSDYALRVSSAGIAESAVELIDATVWGVPSDPRHDRYRAECLNNGGFQGTCPSPYPEELPFLTNPTACPGTLLGATALADSWQEIGKEVQSTTTLPAVDGCNQLAFEPTIQARPTTNLADSPSGLDFDLHLKDEGLTQPEGLATAHLRNATVTLPKGMVVNPASANGLGACSEAQVGYQPGTIAPAEFTPEPASCPDSAKLGRVEISTPLLKEPLPAPGQGVGAVYLARPFENPFGSLLAVYLTVEDPFTGIVIKLAGKVTPDPQTGQLTTTFEDNPQQPVEDFKLKFFGGARGPLRTPATCGTFQTTSVLTPWSAPESGPPATPHDEFQIAAPPSGTGACPQSAGSEPNRPAFHAGTETPQAAAFSPFSLKLVRQDGEQELKGIDTTLPPGLTGKLAGVAECSDAQLAAAAASGHTGAAEQASPSCPLSSEVGVVNVGAGAGPDPYYVQGHAYLSGPYKGAPISLAIITPAVAGPFDLGTVVVRTALYVNPETAQIHAVSDEIPHILQGIPLDVRSVALKMSRPNFTLNPTNCNELGFTGSALTIFGQSAPLTQRFQVGGCSALAFAPKLAISLKGGTKRNQNPALKAILTAKPGEANIAAAQVTLPHSEFLDQAHIGTVCTRVQFAEGSVPGGRCPAASIYGFAKAITPLLDKPLEGPVYLRSSSNKLPDLVAALNGQIAVALDGKVDTGKGGGIRNTFEVVPDAPVSKFTLEMAGGKKGLLVNSENLCSPKAKTKAVVDFTAQNGKVSDTTSAVQNSCNKKGRKGKHHKPQPQGRLHR